MGRRGGHHLRPHITSSCPQARLRTRGASISILPCLCPEGVWSFMSMGDAAKELMGRREANGVLQASTRGKAPYQLPMGAVMRQGRLSPHRRGSPGKASPFKVLLVQHRAKWQDEAANVFQDLTRGKAPYRAAHGHIVLSGPPQRSHRPAGQPCQ